MTEENIKMLLALPPGAVFSLCLFDLLLSSYCQLRTSEHTNDDQNSSKRLRMRRRNQEHQAEKVFALLLPVLRLLVEHGHEVLLTDCFPKYHKVRIEPYDGPLTDPAGPGIVWNLKDVSLRRSFVQGGTQFVEDYIDIWSNTAQSFFSYT